MLSLHSIAVLSVLFAPAASSPLSQKATWSLRDNYNASSWMDMFSVQSGSDPANGYVNWLTLPQAQSQGLYRIRGNQVYIGVDNTSTLDPHGVGRSSVKVVSNAAYTGGLMIADLKHMPGNDCGSWPSFWTVGPNWPYNGEIDIIEGISLAGANQYSLHTGPGCIVIVAPGGQTGYGDGETNCGVNNGANGCGVFSDVAATYGNAFNVAGGGVYAMIANSTNIAIWFFGRSKIPADITQGKPDPNGWGTPQANFGGCAFADYFKDNRLVFSTDFCGGWANSQWPSSSCSSKTATCQEYVAANPGAFSDAYWLINSLHLYQ